MKNDEHFSSSIKLFHLYGSTKYPSDTWHLLGKFHADDQRRKFQSFQLEKPSITRYLKLVILSYHGDEYYCTLSLLRVHGLTLLEDLKQENSEEEEKIKMPTNTTIDSSLTSISNIEEKTLQEREGSSSEDFKLKFQFENEFCKNHKTKNFIEVLKSKKKQMENKKQVNILKLLLQKSLISCLTSS
jgi:hypothetical protein